MIFSKKESRNSQKLKEFSKKLEDWNKKLRVLEALCLRLPPQNCEKKPPFFDRCSIKFLENTILFFQKCLHTRSSTPSSWGDTVDCGEQDVNDGVEDDVRDEQVDSLGRKLCFVQVNRQKNGGDANAEGRVANEPVSPVELKTDPIGQLF